jgi:hypothetical protein
LSAHTLTERQSEFGHLATSKSLMPVIVPMYLDNKQLSDVFIETKTKCIFKGIHSNKKENKTIEEES